MNRVNCACLQQSLFHHMQHSARHTNSFTTTVRKGIWPALSPSHWSGRPNSQGSMHLPTQNHSTNYPPGSINYFLGQLWGPAAPYRYQGQPQGQELPALVLLWQPPVARRPHLGQARQVWHISGTSVPTESGGGGDSFGFKTPWAQC